MNLSEYLHEQCRLVDSALDRWVPLPSAQPENIHKAMRYSLFAGGKRIRPILCMSAARVVSDQVSGLEDAACTLELIHTYSLIHDDLPALDNDDLRRGRPTCHKVFGEAMAILAGDGMISLAFELIATDADPLLAPKLVAELARATGPQGMIGGQVLDMEGEQKSLRLDELQNLHRMKTGALLQAACRLGGIAANATEGQLSGLTLYGRYLGLAFQIVDDVLDVTASPEQMGKATGKDAARGKNTYPALLGVDETRRQATAQLDEAVASLKPLGASADGLRSLASFVVQRQV